MANGQPVAEFRQYSTRVLCGVGKRKSVVQVDLNFSPTGMAVIGEPIEQTLVVLLGGIEICMNEWAAVMVSQAVYNFWVFSRPPFQASLLL
jgi:hypothetical protein